MSLCMSPHASLSFPNVLLMQLSASKNVATSDYPLSVNAAIK